MRSLEENAENLSGFGLTPTQAKVYLAIAQLGLASVSEVSKVAQVRREDVYRIMPKLEKIGLIEKILNKPTKMRIFLDLGSFKTESIVKAISLLLKLH